jgi:hypothetical protein
MKQGILKANHRLGAVGMKLGIRSKAYPSAIGPDPIGC